MMAWFCLKGFVAKKQKGSCRSVSVEIGVVLKALEKVRSEEKALAEDMLAYLSRNWKDLQQDSSIIEALKETKFVVTSEAGDGDLYKPKDLFDPGDALLTSLFPANKFPGKSFASYEWLQILRKTGLQTTHDANTLLQCARRIEYLGAQSKEDQVSLEIWSLAETLVDTIFENNVALLHDLSFCIEFGKIACIPAEKGLPGKTGVRKRVICSYSEAILLKDWALAWSVAPILSKVPPDYSWKALQLRSPPPFTLVLDHLQPKLIDRTVTFPLSCFFTLEDATFEVLKYLETNWGTLSSSDVSKLSGARFIPTSDRAQLGAAYSFVTHLKINLSPIAHQLPSRYLPFVNTLKKLGLHDTLSMSSAMMFLSRWSRYSSLNLNELCAVIELLNFICNEIEQQNLDKSKWESELRVPDIDCRLVRPNMCVYIDPFGSQYIGFSKPRLVHHDVSERLCLAFGIRKFSDIFVEELDCVEHLKPLEEIGSVSLGAIKLKLLSRSFQVAVSSVVNNISSITAGFKNIEFSKLERSLVSIARRLQFVESIYTRFRCLDASCASSVVPEWERESRLYYVDRSNTCMLIAEPPSYVRVVDLVASVVSHVLGSPVPLPIGSLFLCPHNLENGVVNILNLSSHEREMGTKDR